MILSFPYGAFDKRHVGIARASGYKKVFSTLPTMALMGKDEYLTGRIRVDPTDWAIEFYLKILGAYRWLPAAFSLKRQIRHFLKK